MRARIAITGLGVVTACGAGKNALRNALFAEKSAVRRVDLFDASTCRCQTAAQISQLERPDGEISQRKWRWLDRASQMLLIAACEAFADAKLLGAPVNAPLVLATTGGGMRSGELYHRALLQKKSRRGVAYWLSNYLAHQQPLDLQQHFRVRGPIIALANACSSSANAIGYAAQLIQHGEADIVIAGGYESLCELIFVGFDSLMAATPTVCRPFDKNRDGMVLGEGAAVLILENFERARARRAQIFAEFRGYGQSLDTHHLTQPHPEGVGALAAMQMACDDAKISPEKIDYINAHGTATPQNDAMEAKAIRKLLGERAAEVPVSSTKSITGHTLGAAGAVEAAISVLALAEQFVPPNVNFSTPDDVCALKIAASVQKNAPLRAVLSNSFGFGGVNASLIFALP
jgi:3-oxoacyl-[acyl-carrier-protein] synthase II